MPPEGSPGNLMALGPYCQPPTPPGKKLQINMQPTEQTLQGLPGKTGAQRPGGGRGICTHLSIRMASVFRSFSSQVSFNSAMILSVSYKGGRRSLRHMGPVKQPLCPSSRRWAEEGDWLSHSGCLCIAREDEKRPTRAGLLWLWRMGRPLVAREPWGGGCSLQSPAAGKGPLRGQRLEGPRYQKPGKGRAPSLPGKTLGVCAPEGKWGTS